LTRTSVCGNFREFEKEEIDESKQEVEPFLEAS
jgi:hypothetical protein